MSGLEGEEKVWIGGIPVRNLEGYEACGAHGASRTIRARGSFLLFHDKFQWQRQPRAKRDAR